MWPSVPDVLPLTVRPAFTHYRQQFFIAARMFILSSELTIDVLRILTPYLSSVHFNIIFQA